MTARLRSWWQKIKQHSFIATGIILVLFVLIVFIFAAYRFGWSWTGFLNKTLWDWLQLLIIPLVLAVVALLFNLASTRREQKIAAQRYEQDQQITLDKQREDTLQAYLDRISELLLKSGLRTSPPDAEVRNVARVRTLTVLSQLDTRRKNHMLSFLREAKLVSPKKGESVITFQKADFTGADLMGVDLSQTDLSFTDLSGADLSGANLSLASLSLANLRNADLSGANLRKTYLSDADLSEANLIGAKNTTDEQLNTARSLQGAVMPNGSKHP